MHTSTRIGDAQAQLLIWSVSNVVQDITVDLSGCVNDVQISSLHYGADQDEFHVAVVKPFVRVEASLVDTSCRFVGTAESDLQSIRLHRVGV